MMIKSLATFYRIHFPVEYSDYLEEKREWVYDGSRVRQKIKVNKIAGEKEWTFIDWLEAEHEEDGDK